MFGAPFFVAATHGTPFDHLALVASWTSIPPSHGLLKIGATVLGCTVPIPSDSTLKHTLSLSVKKAHFLGALV